MQAIFRNLWHAVNGKKCKTRRNKGNLIFIRSINRNPLFCFKISSAPKMHHLFVDTKIRWEELFTKILCFGAIKIALSHFLQYITLLYSLKNFLETRTEVFNLKIHF
jgi:hypothetical protein